MLLGGAQLLGIEQSIVDRPTMESTVELRMLCRGRGAYSSLTVSTYSVIIGAVSLPSVRRCFADCVWAENSERQPI
jgi:hypothetical protein